MKFMDFLTGEVVVKNLTVLLALILVFSTNSAQATRVVLDNVPHYQWWYCFSALAV